MINSTAQSLKVENFWIIAIWASIFMGILTWDQEKIVVLNLILFSYFLYYMVSERIFSTLTARKFFLLDSMLVGLKTQESALFAIVTEVSAFITQLNYLILAVFRKAVAYVSFITSNTPHVDYDILNSYFVFELAQLSLNFNYKQFISKSAQLNLFTASAVTTAIEPTFEAAINNNSEF